MDDATRKAAQEAALGVLIESLHDPSEEVRKQAAQKLMYLGERAVAAVPALTTALQDPKRDVRFWAAIAIPRIAIGAAGPALPLLIEALDASELWFREGAACSIMWIGSSAAAAVPALIRALRLTDLDPTTDLSGAEAVVRLRMFAAIALGNIGPDAEAAIPVLVEALEGPDQAVASQHTGNLRGAVVDALGRFGPKAESALPGLTRALEDQNKDVRSRAAAAIASITA